MISSHPRVQLDPFPTTSHTSDLPSVGDSLSRDPNDTTCHLAICLLSWSVSLRACVCVFLSAKCRHRRAVALFPSIPAARYKYWGEKVCGPLLCNTCVFCIGVKGVYLCLFADAGWPSAARCELERARDQKRWMDSSILPKNLRRRDGVVEWLIET